MLCWGLFVGKAHDLGRQKETMLVVVVRGGGAHMWCVQCVVVVGGVQSFTYVVRGGGEREDVDSINYKATDDTAI